MSKVLYLDYNATSPLADSVKEFLVKGDVYFSNPSSLHSSGKKADFLIKEVKEFLFEFFALDANMFKLFFHSGATEGINTIIKGYFFKLFQENKKGHFFCASTDHSSVFNMRDTIKMFGHETHLISVDKNGDFDQNEVIKQINKIKKEENVPVLLNYTYVNNETGVVWPLQKMLEIKKVTDCFVHVDAAQIPGKVENWWELDNEIDAYTFSGHKFGAMKGVGFSFFKNSMNIAPLFSGGGQQHGIRPGTENVLGIFSIKLALLELKEKFDYQATNQSKIYVEDSLEKLLGDKGEIVSKSALKRNSNTIYFIIFNKSANESLMIFDLNQIEVGTGSACSSKTVEASRVLKNMGYSEEDAKSAIRISFEPCLNLDNAKKIVERLKEVIEKFKKNS